MKRLIVLISGMCWLAFGGIGVQAAQKVKIGVIHLLDHPDHVLLRESFLDELKSKGYELEVTVFNADSVTYPDTYTLRAAAEAQRMEADGVQLIYCTATYHGVAAAPLKIPVIDGVMLSPDLLQLAAIKADGNMYCSGNATGTLFGYSFKDIVAFARDTLPKAQQLAYLYNPQSPVSRPLAEIEAAAKAAGFAVVDCPFTAKAEAEPAMQKAVANSQIAFVTNDIGVMGVAQPMLAIAGQANYPVIVATMPLVGEPGVVAGIQYNWERAGRICAGKADLILKGAPAKTLPLEVSDQFEIQLNLKVAEKLGLTIPYSWIELATKVIQ